MPRKDKDEYNQYMSEYRKKKTQEKNAKSMTIEEHKEIIEDKMDNIDLESVGKELYKTAKKATRNPVTQEEDPLFKFLDKAEKYAPIVLKLLSGFTDAAKSFQSTMQVQMQPMQQQMPQGIQAPEGWVGMPPMERLKRKYDGSGWYEAGIRYEEAKSGVPAYSQPVQITRRDQPSRNDPMNAPAPKSMRDLSRKYGEDNWDNDSATEDLPERSQDNDQPITKKEKEELKEEMMTNDDKLRQISKTLNEDAKRYIMMGIDYLKKLDMETFKTKVDELDQLFAKFAPLAQMLMPVHLKEAVRNTASSDLVAIAQQEMPDKYAYMVENDKLGKLTEMFDKFKEMI